MCTVQIRKLRMDIVLIRHYYLVKVDNMGRKGRMQQRAVHNRLSVEKHERTIKRPR
jgi:hypothetical protein